LMGKEDARNMESFTTEWIWIISPSSWLFKKEYIILLVILIKFSKFHCSLRSNIPFATIAQILPRMFCSFVSCGASFVQFQDNMCPYIH
jgi:hypothetical protein